MTVDTRQATIGLILCLTGLLLIAIRDTRTQSSPVPQTEKWAETRRADVQPEYPCIVCAVDR